MNVPLLKSKMALKEINQGDLAKLLNIEQCTLSRKLNEGVGFKMKEIEIIQDVLELSPMEVIEIFFKDNFKKNYEGREIIDENQGSGPKDE